MEETIEIIVKVRINYEKKSERKAAIRKAKECVTGVSILGMTGCKPKSAKLFNQPGSNV